MRLPPLPCSRCTCQGPLAAGRRNRHVAACTLLVLVGATASELGCTRSDAATRWSSGAALAPTAPEPTTPYAHRNEVFEATVTIFGVHAADARLEVHSANCGLGPRADAAVLSSSARATGIAALLRDAHIEITTALDVRTGLPISDESHFAVDAKPRDYKVQFDRGSYAYDYRRSDGLAIAERVTVPEGQWAHDLHSGAVLLRSWRPELGKSAHVFGLLGRHMWRVQVVSRGPDVLVRGQGVRAAVQLEGIAEQLTGEEKGVSRTFRVWLSDDADRIPLRARLDSKWGDVRLELVRYQQTEAPEGCPAGSPATHAPNASVTGNAATSGATVAP